MQAFRALVLAASVLTPSAAHADVSLTPRFFLYFDNLAQRPEALDNIVGAQPSLFVINGSIFGPNGPIPVTSQVTTTGSVARSESIVYSMFGGSVSVDLDAEKNWQLTVSGMRGKGKSDFEAVQSFRRDARIGNLVAVDIADVSISGRINFKRTDLEATLQRRLNENVALLGGVRLEQVRANGAGFGTVSESQNAILVLQSLLGFPPPDSLVPRIVNASQSGRNTTDLLSGRIGIATNAQLTSRDVVFANLMAHYDYGLKDQGAISDIRTGQVFKFKRGRASQIGPDLIVGFNHSFSEKISVDVRYRATVYVPLNQTSSNEPIVSHGLNLGVTLRI